MSKFKVGDPIEFTFLEKGNRNIGILLQVNPARIKMLIKPSNFMYNTNDEFMILFSSGADDIQIRKLNLSKKEILQILLKL